MSKAKKVKDIKDLTAVQWWWKADDKWIKYNDDVNLSLELDYQNSLKKIKVDDERFVDVSLTVSLLNRQICIILLILIAPLLICCPYYRLKKLKIKWAQLKELKTTS